MKRPSPAIAPFHGIRYNLQKKDPRNVTAPPYDVISRSEQESLYARDPHNIVRVDLGLQLPADTEHDNRYTRAALELGSWFKQGILIRDPEPAYYLYEQSFEGETPSAGRRRLTRRGFLALRRLESFRDGKIRPHEKTLSGPKADRLMLMKATGANLSPIFCLYSDPGRYVDHLFESCFKPKPLFDFVDEQNVGHRLWRNEDEGLFRKVDGELGQKNLLIADGHHRYETALAYRDWVRDQNPGIDSRSSVNYVMTFFSNISDPGLAILPTHRILKNWPGFQPESFKARLGAFFEMTAFDPEKREDLLKELQSFQGKTPAIGLVLGADRPLYLAKLSEEGRRKSRPLIPDGLRDVDTAVLHLLIFREILGLGEPEEKDHRHLKFVKEAENGFAAAREQDFNAAFLLNSLSIKILQDVTESGLVLPPKTTFFYPKLLTGLVINQLNPEEIVEI